MRASIPIPWLICFALLVVSPGRGDEQSQSSAATDAGRLDVSRAWSDFGGSIISQQDHRGKKVLHGVQVSVGAGNRLKEFAVYNTGALEQRCQFYPNGRTFREQRREHNGDGQEVIYSPQRDKVVAQTAIVADGTDIGPIKTQEVICQGQIKADKRWSGTFLVPHLDGFVTRLMRDEYKDGKLVGSEPFSVDRLALPKGHAEFEGWLWDFPDWPAPAQN